MNPYQILEAILEALADGRQEGESITDYKKRKADELEKHFTNKEEEAKTKARAYRHQYKKEKKEWKNNPQIGAEKALDTADKALNNMIKSSDARRKKWEVQGIKKKMNKNEALEIMEEIINEVSLKKWKEAAKNSIEGREKEAAKSLEATDKGWQEYEKEARKHPEDEPQLFKLAQVNDAAAYKDKERAEHAAKVAYNAPDSKHSANKFLKAARNAEEFHMDKADYRKPAHKDEHYKKAMYARHQASMDPVKSRTSEALEIMEEIINIVSEDELHDQKAIRRNAEKNAKGHAYKAKQFERRSDRAIEQGRERKAEALYDKANAEWDKETAEQDRAAKAHHKVEELRYGKESINCALDLMEQIVDFADNLFELDLEQKQNISPNKVSRVKKDKNGEKVEVVSVADELFPYEGDAKQQFNQKVLAKINDMIEGTGSLEDLIQFVRKGVAMKKQNAHEGYEGAEEILEDMMSLVKKLLNESNPEAIQKAANKRAYDAGYHSQKQFNDGEVTPEGKKALKKFAKIKELIRKREDRTGDWAVKHSELADSCNKGWGDSKKVNGPFEALEEIKNVAEGLFKKDERGDLLDDIDTTLGSPVKKKLADIKAKMTGCKETKVHEALDLMEEIINEVSVKRWKEAAKNSIPTRQAAQDANQADYDYFNGRIPKDMQRKLDKEHAERDNYHNDRVGRAEYLSKNLSDSKRSANQVKNAAEKVVKSRSSKSDKYNDSTNKNVKIATEFGVRGDKKTSGKYWDKAAKSSDNKVNSIEREDHARSIAGKTLRDATKETGHKLKEKEGTRPDNISYKERNKDIRTRVEKAEKAYDRADDKKEDIFGRTEKDRARTELLNAQHAADRKFSKHKR
jgi:hypothetical protein